MLPTSLLAAFTITFGVSAALTPLVRRLAERTGFYAKPARDRWHRRPVALLGGVAIAGAFVIGAVLTTDVRPILPVLVSSGLLFTLGLADDLWRVRPATKLVGQMVVAAVLIYLAPSVHLTGSPLVDQLLAFAWIIGVTNAFNLLDNIDGLSAGVAAIAGIFYLVILVPAGSSPMTAAIACFVGAVLAFLIYNFQPASIFMGDCGSLFLGSFLAAVSLQVAPDLKAQAAQVGAIPLFILLIPIFDTAFVTLTRGLAGRSVIIGGRDHTSHRLVALGISERRAVLSLYGLAVLGGLAAVSLQRLGFGYTVILMGLYVILLAGLGVVLGHVEATHAGDALSESTKAPLVSELTYRYRIYEVLLDTALVAVAYYAAFRIRFDEPQFTQFLPPFAKSFPIVTGCHLAGLWFAGKYRQVWRSFGSTELVTILRGIAMGLSASVILVLYAYRFEGFSRAVFVIDGVILAFLLVGSRVAITTIDEYLRLQRTQGREVLIYGAGLGGELLLRELLQNSALGLTPVGFIDDDPRKRRLRLEGLPVVGNIADLPTLLRRRRRVSEVLISIRDLDAERCAVVASICEEHGATVRRLRFALEEIEPLGAPLGVVRRGR